MAVMLAQHRFRSFRRQARYRPAHPPLRAAVIGDVLATLRYRSEPDDLSSRLATIRTIIALSWTTDAFFAQLMYRLKATLQARGVPLLPRLAHRLAMMSAQVCIGDPVVVQPGLYLPHGQVVIDGITSIGENVVIAPWTTIGLLSGNFTGPTVGAHVHIGTGARLIGPITIGDHVQVGANAVVLDDIPAGHTAIGVPASARPPASPSEHTADRTAS